MTFAQARNAIVSGLEAHIGCPVNLSEQIADMPEYPYCYYSVLAPRIPEYSFGLQEIVDAPDGRCSSVPNRCRLPCRSPFAARIGKPRTATSLARTRRLNSREKANGFFLLNAHNIQTEQGEVVIVNVGSVASRSSFFVEDTIRRYGFDIRFSYVRTDTMPATLVERPGNPIGDIKQ